MQKPFKFFVIWRNNRKKLQQFDTDSEHTALITATRRNGTAYIDTRYEARMRMYNYLLNKARN